MKRFVIAAAMAAALTSPAMANDLKTSGDDLATLSTQGTGLGAILGGAGLTTGTIVVIGTIIATSLAVASASSGSGT